MAFYQSEITNFINELKEKNPQLEQEQQEARAIFWEKSPLNLEERKRNKQANIAQKPYVYYTQE